MLHSLNYIYYNILKTQIYFNETEPTLEFNRFIFIKNCQVVKFPNNVVGDNTMQSIWLFVTKPNISPTKIGELKHISAVGTI